MRYQFLSVAYRHILSCAADVLVGRTYDASTLEVQLLYAVGSPSDDTCHCEDRCVYLLWQSYHLIYETGVEVEVGTCRFATLTMLHQALDTLLLDEFQEFVLFFPTLLLSQFACELLQFYGTRVAQGVYGMTDTIDESRLVVSLLVEHTL